MPPEPWLLAAISALAGFTAWLIRAYIGDLQKQRDAAITGWREQTIATNRLAAAVEARNRRDAGQRRQAGA